MTLQEELQQKIGPAPQPVGDFRWFGINWNKKEQDNYNAARQVYDSLAHEAAKQIIPQALNPLRQSSLGEAANVAGFNPQDIATPEQYRTRIEETPSLVPKTALHYTAEGAPPMGTVLTSGPSFRPQGPPNLQLENPLDTSPYAKTQEVYPRDQAPMQETPVQLQGPPNPARPEFYQREGDPLQTQVRELDTQAPATLPQQMLGTAGIHREGSWPRSQGSGGTKQFQYNQIAQAYGKNAADYWLAEGMLPGGLKAENLAGRTETSTSRGNLLDTQAEHYRLKNQDYPRMAEDRHENTQSLIHARENGSRIANTMAPLRAEVMRLDAALKEKRLSGDSPELQQSQAKIDLAREKLTLLEKVLAATKGEVNDETREILWEDISGMAGIVGEIGKQSFWNKLNPFTPAPQPQRQGQGAVMAPVPGTPPPSTGIQSQSTSSPQSQSFADAPPGSKPGQVLQKDGKPVATWNGKEWVPR